jgi:sigma-54 specific flagellar transcriptional regulator A
MSQNPAVVAREAPEPAASPRLPTGRSAAIRDVVTLIRQVAAHDSSVLILGESGTGKEVVARAIHDSSPRAQRPFVAINCGAIPAELLESELFGHEKGAFTGAISARKGRFEIADGGTLFLDEIGDMSLTMQVKLLRVVQERSYERVGSHLPIRANVRIIAATHRNLEESILKGSFRGDLFYRLNVFPIETPALRARMEDLPDLIGDFVRQNESAGRARVRFSERALDALTRYAFPGNVRELANLVERLSIVCADRPVEIGDLPARYRPQGWEERAEESARSVSPSAAVRPDHDDEEPSGAFMDLEGDVDADAYEDAIACAALLPPGDVEGVAQLPPKGIDLRSHLAAIERALISQALQRAGGTVAKAARLLHLRRTTLVEKLRKLGLAGV